MLPFGSVLSLVSGTVLAFVYLLYFGACALNRSKPEITADVLHQKEIHADNHNNTTLQNKIFSSYFYSQEVPVEEDKQFRIPEHAIFRLKDSPEDIPPVSWRFELTSRPPPFVS